MARGVSRKNNLEQMALERVKGESGGGPSVARPARKQIATVMKKHKTYALHDGMVLQREFYGRLRKLLVVGDGNAFKFKIDDRMFESLTAAARYVVGDETRQINGPLFWSAPSVR